MDGRTNGRTDERTKGLTDGRRTTEITEGLRDGSLTDGRTGGRTDRPASRRIHGQGNERTAGQLAGGWPAPGRNRQWIGNNSLWTGIHKFGDAISAAMLAILLYFGILFVDW